MSGERRAAGSGGRPVDGELDGPWQARRMAFGALAEVYEAVRPDWPAATARWLTGTEPSGPLSDTGAAGLRVLDLGAGTGKLTRTLLAAGHQVTAVDPSAGMLERLRTAVPPVRAVEGTAERIPLPDGSFDAVTVAQAWHWFEAATASAECARVLRPGGVLGVGWHQRDDRVPWVAELNRMVSRPDRDGDALLGGGRLEHDPSFGFAGPFGAPQTAAFDYSQLLPTRDLAVLASSWSYVALRPDRAAVLVAVERLAKRVAGPDGTVRVPHVTRCYRAFREPG